MKKTTASTPQGLAGANAAYCQRMAQLAQESQQRWLELGRRLAGDNAEKYLSTLAPLQQSGNWQEIAPALGEITRKQWQCQLEASQACVAAVLLQCSPIHPVESRRRGPTSTATLRSISFTAAHALRAELEQPCRSVLQLLQARRAPLCSG